MKNRAVTLAQNLVDDVIAKLGNLASRALQAGKGMVQGLIDGINDKIGEVKSAASNVASAISDRLPGSDAETGPLSHLTDQAKSLSTTLAENMSGNIRPVAQASEEVARAAMPAPDMPTSMPAASSGGNTNVKVNVRIEGDADEDDVRQGVSEGLEGLGPALKAHNVRD